MSPVATVFVNVVNEMGEWVLWLKSWNIYGIPCLYYFIGITILYILIDRIF